MLDLLLWGKVKKKNVAKKARKRKSRIEIRLREIERKLEEWLKRRGRVKPRPQPVPIPPGRLPPGTGRKKWKAPPRRRKVVLPPRVTSRLARRLKA